MPKTINFCCGEWRIRTSEGVRQQIYSLIHLATLETPQKSLLKNIFRPVSGLELQNYMFLRCCQQVI